ncbi:hypothetical protein [Alteribacter aurantiacus]|uniref:hypothetical protein n=1 Tax=Alteribacter aurantiacus TaxID=254410 RepID=UPI00040039CE|nr:hypothetical protein [Alteribacter aurantiacus]
MEKKELLRLIQRELDSSNFLEEGLVNVLVNEGFSEEDIYRTLQDLLDKEIIDYSADPFGSGQKKIYLKPGKGVY